MGLNISQLRVHFRYFSENALIINILFSTHENFYFNSSFVFYIFVNIGMVSGILPVVGVPLPLISYGGTAMITLSVCFGIIMSVQTHKRELSFK